MFACFHAYVGTNLQFVRDCEEEGIKKYKVKVNKVVEEFMKKFIYYEEKGGEIMNPELQSMGVNTRVKTKTMHYKIFTQEDLEELMKKINEVN